MAIHDWDDKNGEKWDGFLVRVSKNQQQFEDANERMRQAMVNANPDLAAANASTMPDMVLWKTAMVRKGGAMAMPQKAW